MAEARPCLLGIVRRPCGLEEREGFCDRFIVGFSSRLRVGMVRSQPSGKGKRKRDREKDRKRERGVKVEKCVEKHVRKKGQLL